MFWPPEHLWAQCPPLSPPFCQSQVLLRPARLPAPAPSITSACSCLPEPAQGTEDTKEKKWRGQKTKIRWKQ